MIITITRRASKVRRVKFSCNKQIGYRLDMTQSAYMVFKFVWPIRVGYKISSIKLFHKFDSNYIFYFNLQIKQFFYWNSIEMPLNAECHIVPLANFHRINKIQVPWCVFRTLPMSEMLRTPLLWCPQTDDSNNSKWLSSFPLVTSSNFMNSFHSNWSWFHFL